MFSLQIVDTDAFLTMPASAQNLYFHLGLRADDDGFVASPRKIAGLCNASDDDMKILIAKRFILTFESGIIVIKHWKIHNYIQNDRYHETKYVDEKNGLILKENGAYTEKKNEICTQNVSRMDTEVRLGKVRLEEIKIEPQKTENVDKVWTDGIEPYKQKYAPSLFEEFENHWRAKNIGGLKELWQMQRVFDFGRRLKTWKRNQEKWERERNFRQSIPADSATPKLRQNYGGGLQKISF